MVSAIMTRNETDKRIEVLEERLDRLAGAVIVLLEAIDNGTAKDAAREIWETLQQDLEPPM